MPMPSEGYSVLMSRRGSLQEDPIGLGMPWSKVVALKFDANQLRNMKDHR